MSTVGVSDLADEWGTPLYVYQLDDVRHAFRELLASLPEPSRLYYSVKANPHPDVAGELARLGAHAEIASRGEILLALSAGFRPDTLLMTGPGKSPGDISEALRQGIRRFSVDSPDDLARVGALARLADIEVQCLLRVNADEPVPGMGLAMTGTASQFGSDASQVLARPELFRESGNAHVTGLHLYMGTNIADIDTLTSQFTISIRLAARLRHALGVALAEVDLGGGFGMPYARAGTRPAFGVLRDRIEPLLDEHFPGWRSNEPTVSFESGRYLVGGCGQLVCRVLDVKASKDRMFIVLDSGINHLGGMSGLRRIPRIVPDLLPVVDRGGQIDGASLAGPLCTPLDSWAQQVLIPEMRLGDLVTVPNAGAYGLTASLIAFLGHPAPREVVLDGETIISVSEIHLDRRSLSPVDPKIPRDRPLNQPIQPLKAAWAPIWKRELTPSLRIRPAISRLTVRGDIPSEWAIASSLRPSASKRSRAISFLSTISS